MRNYSNRIGLVLLVSLLFSAAAAAYTEHIGAGQTVIAKLCPLHHLHLRPGTAQVAYAPSIDALPYFAAAKRYFPYAGEAVYGGASGRATTANVYYCPACRKAFEGWKQQREDAAAFAVHQHDLWLQRQQSKARQRRR